MTLAEFLTLILVWLTLFGNVAFVLLMISHVVAKPLFVRLMRFVGERALPLGTLLSSASTIGVLIYSEVTGFPACILCWIQRIFMFPQMFLYALAWKRGDRGVLPYTLLLSSLGALVALYQWIKDMLALYGHITLTCPDVPGLPSCDKIFVEEFGYITIPMIALNAFLWLIVVAYAALRSEKFTTPATP